MGYTVQDSLWSRNTHEVDMDRLGGFWALKVSHIWDNALKYASFALSSLHSHTWLFFFHYMLHFVTGLWSFVLRYLITNVYIQICMQLGPWESLPVSPQGEFALILLLMSRAKRCTCFILNMLFFKAKCVFLLFSNAELPSPSLVRGEIEWPIALNDFALERHFKVSASRDVA